MSRQDRLSGVRRLLGRRPRRVVQDHPGTVGSTPLLSIVIPVHNTEAYLVECLDSLLDQSLREVEIICVDDGSTDRSGEILRDYAMRDPRVTVIAQPQRGQGAARNVAVAQATGRFLTFCDSDDTVPATAYETMVRTLEQTGSDFVLGMARRFRADTPGADSWPEVHRKAIPSTTVDAFPLVMRDIIACNRVIRTAFWRDQVGAFPEGVAYEDHLPMLTCTIRADRFDVLSSVTYNWRQREDGTSTSQQKQATANLMDRLAALDQARALLWSEASSTVQQAWVSRVLDIDLPFFLPYALSADENYRAALAAHLKKIFALAEPEGVLNTRYGRRVPSWLAAHERWDDVDAALEHFRQIGVPPSTRVAGPDLVAIDDLDFARDLPAWMRRLSVLETAVIGAVTWVGIEDDELVLHGAALVPGLDTDDNTPRVELRFVRDDEIVESTVSPRVDPELDEWLGHRHTRYADAGFTARVALARLTTAADEPWSVQVRVQVGDLERSGRLDQAQPGSAAAAWETTYRVGPLTARFDDVAGLVLDPARGCDTPAAESPADGPVVHEVTLDARGLVLEIEVGAAGESEWNEATLVATGRVLRPLSVSGSGSRLQVIFPAELSLFDSPPTPLGTGRWKLTPSTAVAPGLASRLPHSIAHGQVRVVLRQVTTAPHELRLQVVRPLRDEERGPVGHEKARQRVAGSVSPALDAVVFWSARGAAFSETWRVLDLALQRRTDWSGERIWGLHDGSTWVPPGARGVLIGSAEWYRILSSARYVLTDHTPPAWARKMAHQRWLQLDLDIGDEPFGVAALAAQHATEYRMRSSAQWMSDVWDGLVTASERGGETARLSRRWQGPVWPLGDPRSDELADPRVRHTIRAAVRSALDIAPETPILLYLPERRARRSGELPVPAGAGELNLSRLIERIGPDWTVLRHGARWRRLASSAQLRDVSEYPRPVQLMCAADVAVLERTEARFLWPLTQQPCLVHLPHQAAPTERPADRPDPGDSFPGPLVSDLSELVRGLDDLEGLTRACRAAYPDFLRLWQPHADGRAADRVIAALFDR